MDWNFKLGSGYLSEFDQESVQEPSPIDGSISFVGLEPKRDFPFDLKLGRNIETSSSSYSAFGNTEQMLCLSKWNESVVAIPEASKGSGSSKRTRGNGVGDHQMPICLVDGCDSDLSNCREYHKRHKVCEVHTKTPVVTISGHKQRFCQQCSRFHSLEEFDEGKRSCRKRLDGHNRRRRKPARNVDFFAGFQGSKLLDFSGGSHVFPSTPVASPSWGNGLLSVPMANSSTYGQNHSYGGTSPAKRGKHFPFLQEESSSGMPSCIHESGCALSLLSSSSPSVPHLLQPPLSLSQEAVETGFYENVNAVSNGSVISGNDVVDPFHWEW